MELFKKKKVEEPQNVPAPLSVPHIEKPVEEPEEKKVEETTPTFAPLFVKLEKYGSILEIMRYLKSNLISLKRSLKLLDNLDKLREENIKLIKANIEKLEKKIFDLDSKFPRVAETQEESLEVSDVETLGATISDLKNQINQLKSELGSIA